MPNFNEDIITCELRQRYESYCLEFIPNSEVENIRGVPIGVRYESVSVLQINISPADLSALETDTGIIKLAVSHVQKPCIYY